MRPVRMADNLTTSLCRWKKPVKCYILGIAMYGDETWTVRKVDQKYLESLKCGAGEGWIRSVGPIV